MMNLNARGVALPYVLMAIVVSGFIIQAFVSNTNTLQIQQASVQRAVDASLFVKGVGNVFDYAIGCTNALGYGYHTSTSASYATTFDPNNPAPQAVARIYDPSGAHNVMYEPFSAASGEPPATSIAAPKLVIRRISLIRNATNWDQGKVDINIADSSFDPATAPDATAKVTVWAVLAKLQFDFEDVSSVRSVFSSSISRSLDVTLYVERPSGGSDPWKIVTCTPNQGKVNLPGWVNPGDIITTGATPNTAECPQSYYAMGMIASANAGGMNVSLQCAQMVR